VLKPGRNLLFPFVHNDIQPKEKHMATTTSSTSKRQVKPKVAARTSTPDAVKLLTNDHAEVKKMFKEFEKRADKSDTSGKVEVANKICMELMIHTQVEEELFYPAARAALKDEDLMNEAKVEHDSAKDLIAQIQSMDPEDAMYDAKVIVLGEYIEHHVKEEEKEMFPKMKKAKCDLEELGEKMAARKKALQKDFMKLDGQLNPEFLRSMALKMHTRH
jgi:hemerythrin superfamily protein